MKYAEKIKHAEKVAEALLDEQSIDQVRTSLKEEGLYDREVDNVIASARNIIGEKLKPIIRSKILAGEFSRTAPEFDKLDTETLGKFVQQELKGIAVTQKRKVNELLKNGIAPEYIYKEIRQEFYPRELIDDQIAAFKETKKQNSAGGRMLNIVGGIALVVIGLGVTIASMQGNSGGVLMYGMIIVGLVMLTKGFITQESPYE
ncbi:MAG: hypothetical protein KTR30_24085 [Saprospiraceae bacterium]|nr:hypothetical protein [Saprospiraceae bacterium]